MYTVRKMMTKFRDMLRRTEQKSKPTMSSLQEDGGEEGRKTLFPSVIVDGGDIENVEAAKDRATEWIRNEVDRNMTRFYVYAGGDYGNNRSMFVGNFSEKWSGSELYEFAPVHDELRSRARSAGSYAMKWKVDLEKNSWASINFQTGVLLDDGRVGPSSGLTSASKVDLSGYRKLRFTLWADEDTACQARLGDNTPEHPDTATRTLDASLAVTTKPREFAFDLSEDDLSSMDTFLTLGIQRDIASEKKHVLYVSNVFYERTAEDEDDGSTSSVFRGCWLKSWDTPDPRGEFDIAMQNVSFVYDQALCLCVTLDAADDSRSDPDLKRRDALRAQQLARPLVYAVENDAKYSDGRLRNAYMCGPMNPPPGFESRGARTPGWWSREGEDADGRTVFVGKEGVYAQDEYAVSTWTGNVAWALIALSAFAARFPEEAYAMGALSAAKKMGDFILSLLKHDGYGGFSGGLFGFDDAEGGQAELGWRSTEHSADAYACFARLAEILPSSPSKHEWRAAARHALRFTDRMFHSGGREVELEGEVDVLSADACLYWTGTDLDGSINRTTLPLDPLLWTIYGTDGLRADATRLRALRWAHDELRVEGKDPFALAKFSRSSQGGWVEGTGQLATAFNTFGFADYATAALKACLPHQTEEGGFYSTDRDVVDTGFALPGSEDAWYYFRKVHLGATAWFALAASFRNPFRMMA